MKANQKVYVSEENLVIPNEVLGISIFIFTEIMFFIGLISSFLIIKSSYATWPPVGLPAYPFKVTFFNTLVLLMSGLSMFKANQNLKNKPESFFLMFFFSLSLGLIFVGIQGFEWLSLIKYGLFLNSSNYGSIFYLIIGAHGFHVIATVLYLLVTFFRVKQISSIDIKKRMLRAPSIFWYFVVFIWPIIFYVVYV